MNGPDRTAPQMGARIPVQLMRAVQRHLLDTAPVLARIDGVYWLVKQKYGDSVTIQRLSDHAGEHMMARLALMGLLDLVLNEGLSTPEVIIGMVSAINQIFTSQMAITEAWEQFVQSAPEVSWDPLVRRGMGEIRHFGTWHAQLYFPALQLYQTLTTPR